MMMTLFTRPRRQPGGNRGARPRGEAVAMDDPIARVCCLPLIVAIAVCLQILLWTDIPRKARRSKAANNTRPARLRRRA